MESLNRFFDSLPRSRLAKASREVPAFRTCGVVGFYCALIVTMAAGFVAGRSPLALALISLVCGLSFFSYAYARKCLSGQENLVLLEHVWFAEACAAITLRLLGLPVMSYLDAIVPGLCVFLAAGRVGCLMVGCCHGNPSSFGIVYNQECARDGFDRDLVGIRLFPVQAVEAFGLLVIGLSTFVALPFARTGVPFAWFLLAYSIMRFGLEAIRGDPRPLFLGLSQARWMSIAEVGFAFWIVDGPRLLTDRQDLSMSAALLAFLMVAVIARYIRDPRRSLLSPAHISELRRLVQDQASSIRSQMRPESQMPAIRATSQGVLAGVSPTNVEHGIHVSMSFDRGLRDLPALCAIATAAVPELSIGECFVSADSTLHLFVPRLSIAEHQRDGRARSAMALYAAVVRRSQEQVRDSVWARAPSVRSISSIDRLALLGKPG